MEAMRPSRPTREVRYEYRDLFLGGQTPIPAQVADMARSGWELIDIRVPHYGSLTIIGQFRRGAPPPVVGDRRR